METICVLNPEGATEEEAGAWRVRNAARAVVLDAQGNVALLHVTAKNYYKLPGGGLEGDENHDRALMRECEEEIGCAITVTGEIGRVIEERKMFNLRQVSYCYRAQVVGEKGEPSFTEEEQEDGFAVVWLPYEEALTALSQSSANDAEGALYIVPRDTHILRAAAARSSEPHEG